MAKQLGPKSTLIREAITANPDKGNTELAKMIAGSDARKQDKIAVTANDVAQQRQAMKKAGTAPAKPAGKKRGRPKGSVNKKAAAPAALEHVEKRAATAKERHTIGLKNKAPVSPVDLIDRLFDLAEDAGGMEQLRRLVERLAPLERA